MLNLVGVRAEVGGLLLRSCGPNEHSLWGSGWSDSHQRVERFAPAGGAIRPIPRQQGRTAVCHKWPCFLVNPALSGQNSRSRESLFEFGIIFARCLAEFLATVSPCGSTSAGSFITSPRPSPPRKERS